jgi:hypothetical protein
MPPGQPIRRCEGPCGLFKPCKKMGDRWLCAACNPNVDGDGLDGSPTELAPDGGER